MYKDKKTYNKLLELQPYKVDYFIEHENFIPMIIYSSRKRSGKKQKVAANEIKRTQGNLSKIENLETSVNLKTWFEIQNIYKIEDFTRHLGFIPSNQSLKNHLDSNAIIYIPLFLELLHLLGLNELRQYFLTKSNIEGFLKFFHEESIIDNYLIEDLFNITRPNIKKISIERMQQNKDFILKSLAYLKVSTKKKITNEKYLQFCHFLSEEVERIKLIKGLDKTCINILYEVYSDDLNI